MSQTVDETTHPPAPPGPHRVVVIAAAAVAAIAVAAAVAIVAVAHWSGGSPVAVAPQPTTPTIDARASDRQLCVSAGPLLRESVDIGKGFVALGHTGTPARDNGIPVFRAQVHDWANRIQPMLDGAAPGFLARSTQRYADDLRLYADNLNPGEATAVDDAAWNDGTVALGAAVTVCGDVGITWWKG